MNRVQLIYSISNVVMAGKTAQHGDWVFTFDWADGYTATNGTMSYTDEDCLPSLVDLMIVEGQL